MIIEKALPHDVPALRELWREAFSDTEGFLDTFFSLPYCCFAAKERGEVLAAAYCFDCMWEGKPLTYLYAVATRKDRRGEGICGKLLTEIHRHLEDTAGTVLVPGEESLRNFYTRFGYRSFGGRRTIEAATSGTPVETERLSAEEYAARRAELLPSGGVEQVGNTLPFLQTQLDFYGGDGWLLAGRVEDGYFIAPEYLGNEVLLPGILKSLKLPEGKISVAGKEPFAMFRPGRQESSAPAYFAFALD